MLGGKPSRSRLISASPLVPSNDEVRSIFQGANASDSLLKLPLRPVRRRLT